MTKELAIGDTDPATGGKVYARVVYTNKRGFTCVRIMSREQILNALRAAGQAAADG